VSPTAEPEQGPAGPIRPLIQIKSSRDRPGSKDAPPVLTIPTG
jgi:hypothetical protein